MRLFAILACWIIASVASATTYYIDYETGDDSRDGLTQGTCWKHYPMDTRATGVSDATTVVAGDVLAPKGGSVYTSSIRRIVPNGSVGNRVIIDGTLWGTGKSIETGNNQAYGSWQDGSTARGNFTIRGIEFRDFGGYAENAAIYDGFTITAVDTSTEVFTTSTIHELVVGDDVQFTVTGGTLPTPILSGQGGVDAVYYVKSTPTPTTFTLSATNGGATINITAAGTGIGKVWEPVLYPPDAHVIGLYGGGENITIEDCDFVRCGQWRNVPPMRNTDSVTGLAIWLESVNNVLIEDCTFKRMKGAMLIAASPSLGPLSGVTVNRCSMSEYMMWGIDVAPRANNATLENVSISNCKIFDYFQHDQGNWQGFGEKPHSNGIFFRNGYSTGVTWTNIRAHGNEFYADNTGNSQGGTADIFISYGPSVLIYNNIFYRTKKANGAVYVAWWALVQGQTVRIYNNTFYGSTTWVRTDEENRGTLWRNVHCANNIGLANGGASNLIMVIQVPTTNLFATLNRNLYFHPNFSRSQNLMFSVNGFNNANLDQVQAMSAGRPNQFEVNSLYQDPLFLDTTGPYAETDWHIGATSPARGMGENFSAYFTHDKDGNPRPSTGAWDVGAYQFNGSPPADVTAPTILSASVDASGGTGSMQFSESVEGVNLAHYAIAGHTLSDLAGSGENRTFSISPVIQAGPAFTLTYTGGAGRTADAAGNQQASATVTGVNNSLETTPTPPRAQRLGPGGGLRKFFGF